MYNSPSVTVTDDVSGTFRSPVFSLLAAKVPTVNIRFLEGMFPGTFVPLSDNTGERTVRVTTSYT